MRRRNVHCENASRKYIPRGPRIFLKFFAKTFYAAALLCKKTGFVTKNHRRTQHVGKITKLPHALKKSVWSTAATSKNQTTSGSFLIPLYKYRFKKTIWPGNPSAGLGSSDLTLLTFQHVGKKSNFLWCIKKEILSLTFQPLDVCDIIVEMSKKNPIIYIVFRKDLKYFYKMFSTDLNWNGDTVNSGPADFFVTKIGLQGSRGSSTVGKKNELPVWNFLRPRVFLFLVFGKKSKPDGCFEHGVVKPNGTRRKCQQSTLMVLYFCQNASRRQATKTTS